MYTQHELRKVVLLEKRNTGGASDAVALGRRRPPAHWPTENKKRAHAVRLVVDGPLPHFRLALRARQREDPDGAATGERQRESKGCDDERRLERPAPTGHAGRAAFDNAREARRRQLGQGALCNHRAAVVEANHDHLNQVGRGR